MYHIYAYVYLYMYNIYIYIFLYIYIYKYIYVYAYLIAKKKKYLSVKSKLYTNLGGKKHSKKRKKVDYLKSKTKNQSPSEEIEHTNIANHHMQLH